MNPFIKLFLFSFCIYESFFSFTNNIFKNEGTLKADDNSESYETRIKRSIINNMQFKWTSPIPYFCRFNVNKTLIQEALAILEKETCLKFNETLDFANGFLRYANGTNRCFSSLGKVSNNDLHNVVVGRDCSDVIGVLHETLHALGVIHEMGRHDRDSYIDVKYENIKPSSQFNFVRYDLTEASSYNLKYDFGSVMHYNRYITTKNNQETMVPKGKYKSYLKTIGQKTRFGFNDAKQLNIYYCSDKCPDSKLKCKMGGYPHPNDCRFCKCPEFYTGRLCNKLLPSHKQCGSTRFLKTNEIDKRLVVSGIKTCYFQIAAPRGRKVRLNIEETDLLDSFVCHPDQGLEIKFLADKSVSGAVLCGKNSGEVIISENNVVVMKYVGLTSNSTIKIQYRDVA
uniref:Metalloendopeptidase n=1 Tax=Strongyloides papillosus TaxID=174720 RepID=A0A0N5BG20_STREA